MIKKNILSFLMVFFASMSIFAQTITVNPTDTPTNVVACGSPGTFKFTVFGPVAAGTKVTATLPTGVTFNSLVTASGVTATAAANVVTFTITSALPYNTDKIDVQYLLNTPCTALPSNPTITYAMPGATNKVVNYPTVGYSQLEVTNVTPSGATIPVFSSQNYSVTVKQSATGSVYSTNIKVLITHSTNVGISSTVGTITPGTVSGGNQTDVLEITGNDIKTLTGGTDNNFDPGETVTIPIKATLKGCTAGETIKLQAAYGCGTSTACTTGNVTNVGLNATSVQDSNLSMTLTKQPWPGFQTSNGDSAKFTLTNTGAGPAYGVAIQFGTTTNGLGGNPRPYFDYYNFAVNGSGRGIWTNPFAEQLFEVIFIDVPTEENLPNIKKQISEIADNIVCFVYEPLVQGAAGMLMHMADDLDKLLSFCRQEKILLIQDEIFVGFGRTGKLFAANHLSESPDIICFSKGLTGGTMPLGLTTCRQEIYDMFYSDDKDKALFHGHSFTASPLACTAALASLDLLLNPETTENIARICKQHLDFKAQLSTHPKVKTARICGTIFAMEWKTNEETSYFSDMHERLYPYFLEKGILMRPLGNIIYLVPPYCISAEDLQYIYDCILLALEEV